MKNLRLLTLLLLAFYGWQSLEAQQVQIVGHRGAAWDAPENTLISAKTAVDQGADAFEIDIHLSQDGQLVVIHDATTLRTTGVDLAVKDTPWSALKDLDAGSFKSPDFAGEPIPLLRDVLDFLPDQVGLFIEIKGPLELVPVLTEELKDFPKRSQISIIAFDLETITEAKRLNPDIPCYYLKTVVLASSYKDLVSDLKARKLDGADLYFRSISAKLVRMLKHEGMSCLAWTVNSPEQARKLIRKGVQGITTDRPGWLRKEI